MASNCKPPPCGLRHDSYLLPSSHPHSFMTRGKEFLHPNTRVKNPRKSFWSVQVGSGLTPKPVIVNWEVGLCQLPWNHVAETGYGRLQLPTLQFPPFTHTFAIWHWISPHQEVKSVSPCLESGLVRWLVLTNEMLVLSFKKPCAPPFHLSKSAITIWSSG